MTVPSEPSSPQPDAPKPERTQVSRIAGERPEGQPDIRVAAVLEVLGGAVLADVASRWTLDPVVLRRWVRDFVAAGAAQVTNRYEGAVAEGRDRFLTAFAHELRGPLSVAQGWVALMVDGDLEPSLVAASIRRLQQALGQLTRRIRDVELLAAASLGRLRITPEQVAVHTLTGELPDPVQLDPSVATLPVQVDPQLFPLVLHDLWAAGGTHPEPRSRHLEVEQVGAWVEFRVVRDADPIDHDVLVALFEPFNANDDATGVTLGLYLARALTVAHGGTIGVDQDDDRAVLWLRVPQQSPLVSGAAPAAPVPPAPPEQGDTT